MINFFRVYDISLISVLNNRFFEKYLKFKIFILPKKNNFNNKF